MAVVISSSDKQAGRKLFSELYSPNDNFTLLTMDKGFSFGRTYIQTRELETNISKVVLPRLLESEESEVLVLDYVVLDYVDYPILYKLLDKPNVTVVMLTSYLPCLWTIRDKVKKIYMFKEEDRSARSLLAKDFGRYSLEYIDETLNNMNDFVLFEVGKSRQVLEIEENELQKQVEGSSPCEDSELPVCEETGLPLYELSEICVSSCN